MPVVAGALVLAACGGSGDADSSGSATPAAASGADGGTVRPALTTGGLDLGGPELHAASQITSNPLPDLVVDDVGRFKQVNLRNLFPAEQPVLLWMWAPH